MNFRKSIALLTAVLMLVSNAGFAMTVHYCGGKISSITSGFSTQETCEIPEVLPENACCAKKMESNHKKCCTDKTVQFKGKTSDIIAKAFSSEMVVPFIIPVHHPLVFASATAPEIEKIPSYYCDAHAPPLFKLYHQYVFYA